MELDSGLFFLFLISVWIVTALIPAKWRVGVLLVASLVFYSASSITYLVLLVAIACVNYGAVRRLTTSADGPRRQVIFAATVILDVLVLAFFKYATGLRAMPGKWGHLAVTLIPVNHAGILGFPLGLSFFTFQLIACVTDVYRRTFEWRANAKSFLLFSLFFPQISSGPIPRASVLAPQLEKAVRVSWADLAAGVNLIAFGLVKKLVVANRLHAYVAQVFGGTYLPLGAFPVAFGFVLNAVEIYADFSGYTDLARGSARLFGIQLGVNFDRPFLAESLTDFWRRWHISLSTWLRDYLYMPLFIRLRDLGKTAAVISLLVTFVICGIWHAASWPMILWGALHGVGLSLEMLTRGVRRRLLKGWPEAAISVCGRIYTMTFVVLAMAIFRAVDVDQAMKLIARLLHPAIPRLTELFAYDGPVTFMLIFVALGSWALLSRWGRRPGGRSSPAFVLACAVIILLLGALQEGNFIYVRF